MEANELLRKIYALYLNDGWSRVPVVEQHLGMLAPEKLSVDDERNAERFYRELVEGHHGSLDEVFDQLRSEMRGLPYEHSAGIIDALRFLQNVLAIALWKYQLDVGDRLEQFTREFDRLDEPHVRRRLHEGAQSAPP